MQTSSPCPLRSFHGATITSSQGQLLPVATLFFTIGKVTSGLADLAEMVAV